MSQEVNGRQIVSERVDCNLEEREHGSLWHIYKTIYYFRTGS